MVALSGIWSFFTGTTIGRYLLLAAAIGIGIWYIRWDAVQEVEAKWEQKWALRDEADKLAKERLSAAKEVAEAAQAAVVADLTDRLKAQQAKPPVVVNRTVVKEVVHAVEKVVNAACTVTNGFVWLRDISFHPEYTMLARTASPEVSGADSGLKATDVAATTGLALGQCRQAISDLTFNLDQWDLWYDKNRRVYEDWQLSVEQTRKERQEPSDVRTEYQQLDRDRLAGGDHLVVRVGGPQPDEGARGGEPGGGGGGRDQANGGPSDHRGGELGHQDQRLVSQEAIQLTETP